MNSIGNIFSIAKNEYIKWIFSSRMLIFLSALIFVNQFATVPLIEMSKEMGVPLHTFEPFIAIANSDMLMMIMPVVFVTLIADFPKNDGNLLFCVQRTGRKSWITGQIIFLIYSSLTFITAVFLSTLVCAFGSTEMTPQWSRTITEYSRTFPDKALSFGAGLIPENLYYQYAPVKSALNSFCLMFLLLILCGLLMLIFSEIGKKLIGMAIDVFLIVAGGAVSYLGSDYKWLFPCCNAIVRTHFTKFFREQIFELRYSYIYFLIIILAMTVLSYILVNRMDFITSEED